MSKEPAPEWVFPSPVKGQHSGGNANQFTVPPDLDSLVRETIQNALDAKLTNGKTVFVRFRLLELTGTERTRFLETLDFAALKPHLEAVTKDPGPVGRSILSGLQRFQSDTKLLCLYVEDAGTKGLEGAEEGHSSFAALVRNDLDSRKSTTTAGGSYGLGKAVLWSCSLIRTAVFGSLAADQESKGLRVIAKADLATHESKGVRYHSAGWLGARDDAAGYALSVFGRANLASGFSLERSDLPPDIAKTGTSMCIVGFHNPSSEDPPDPAELLHEIETNVALWFWPALQLGRLRVDIVSQQNAKTISRRTVDPVNTVPEFCHLLKRYQEGGDKAEGITVRDVVITVPATKPGIVELKPNAQLTATAKLLASVVEAEAPVGVQPANVVARMRGSWMVVDYKQYPGAGSPGRTFHGVLLAGQAVSDTPENVAADQLLRVAEPPAHDAWNNKRNLQEAYYRGVLARLNDFDSEARAQLLEAIRPPLPDEQEGPDDLKKMLALLLPSDDGQARIRPTSGKIDAGAWIVTAKVTLPDPDDDSVIVAIKPALTLDVDGGRPAVVPWDVSSLAVIAGSNVTMANGEFFVTGGTKEFDFSAKTDAAAHPVDAAETIARLTCTMREIEKTP
ncbi:MAG TPA: hypothetical protein VFQ53_43270 [Kofleriaceae bacterium]|nr:hypothetical protein [Kofleriaceae bacterium]